MIELQNLFKFVMCYTLCVVYSTWIGVSLAIAYIFKRDPEMWTVKDRPTPPRSLTSNEFGEHKFMTVNVSEARLFVFLLSAEVQCPNLGNQNPLRRER